MCRCRVTTSISTVCSVPSRTAMAIAIRRCSFGSRRARRGSRTDLASGRLPRRGSAALVDVAIDSIDSTRIGAELAVLDEAEADALVKAPRPRIGPQRIDEHGVDARVGKAPLEREPHHPGAVAFAEFIGLADPEVDCSEIRRTVAPV